MLGQQHQKGAYCIWGGGRHGSGGFGGKRFKFPYTSIGLLLHNGPPQTCTCSVAGVSLRRQRGWEAYKRGHRIWCAPSPTSHPHPSPFPAQSCPLHTPSLPSAALSAPAGMMTSRPQNGHQKSTLCSISSHPATAEVCSAVVKSFIVGLGCNYLSQIFPEANHHDMNSKDLDKYNNNIKDLGIRRTQGLACCIVLNQKENTLLENSLYIFLC